MAKEIKQRIVLEGEKEYSAAIREANRNLKTLRSELKAETAELGKNATEQQKAEVRTKNLKKQIQEQEKAVKTYGKILEEVRQKYGDNEDAIASWEQKLNNARASLANMKNDLEGVGESMQAVNDSANMAVVATTSIADAIGKLGDVGDGIAGAIEDIFTGMVSTVKDALSEVWSMVVATAAKANQWTDIAGYWNTNAQTIQQWYRATESVGPGGFQDLQNAVTKLALGDHDKIKELTGVSWVGDVDEWMYSMDVLSSIASMSHQKRNEALESLFGERRATKVMDLLNDWGKIQELLPQFDGNETGYGMSDEELATMDDLYVKINTISEKWEALKDNVAAGFGAIIMPLTLNVEGALDGVADFLSAENEQEREAALTKIRTNLEEFFRKLGEIIRECLGILNEVGQELQDSDDPVTKAIGDILVGLTEALQWLVDNQDKVTAAIKAILGVWALSKIAAVAGHLKSIVESLRAISLFKGLGGATGAAGAAGAGAGAAGSAAGGAAAGAAGGGIFTAASNWMKGTSAKVAGFIQTGGMFFPVLGDMLSHQTAFGQTLNNGGTVGDALEASKKVVEDKIEEIKENASTFGEDWLNLINTLLTGSPEGVKVAEGIHEGTQGFGRHFGGAEELVEYLDLDEEYSQADRQQAAQDWWDAYRNAMNEDDSWEEEDRAYKWMEEVFGDDFGAVMDNIIQQLDQLGQRQTELENLPDDWWLNGDQWNGNSGGSSQQDGITSSDLQGFRNLPAQLQKATKEGAASGVSGIKVYMDGATVGRLVAPYVSQIIAAQSVI